MVSGNKAGNGGEQPASTTVGKPRSPPVGSLASRLAEGELRAVLTFGGQGAPWLDEITELVQEAPHLRGEVAAVEGLLTGLLSERTWRWSGFYGHGFELMSWIEQPETRPPESYLSSSCISQPLIFLCQVVRYMAVWQEGLAGAFDAGAIAGLSGHSQGMMAALLVAESPGGRVQRSRLIEYVTYMAWQGLHMARAGTGTTSLSGATPMAAISGIVGSALEGHVEACNATLTPDNHLTIALHNGRSRFVVSGPPPGLIRLHQRLEARARADGEARKQGRLGGAPLTFTWEALAVSAPFHSPAMAAGLRAMIQTVKELDFRVAGEDLKLPVLSPVDGRRLDGSADLTAHLMAAQFVEPVRWSKTVRLLAQGDPAPLMLDMGPGEGVARLSGSVLRGEGVEVLALATAGERQRLFSVGATVRRPVLRYADDQPRLAQLPQGQVVVDNRFTRFTGCPPVILPGMTPTTADVPIVAAAANAGFVAELAGGGQVNERIFWLRMEELAESLAPGREVVFNALLLDPWLWELHLGRHDLVRKARRAGFPLMGVTVSAGIPDVAQAVSLLDGLAADGLWLNAFKPGTLAQVDQVVRIAKAAPEHTLMVHLEGGKAGGHHSWEDLDGLLMAAIPKLRALPNLILCAGGGIAHEGRAVELLDGSWALGHQAPNMPVDAVLLGTIAMACQEAATSQQVKRALAEAAGDPDWVLSGDVRGGLTSGRSQLNADIHYLDNAASRCGRLLDEVAGDGPAVAARHDEIVAALATTCRPWFGDLETMTGAELLRRMLALMAIGRGGRYEDGRWPDVTWRQRFADMLWRLEARLAGSRGLADPQTSVLASVPGLDVPETVLDSFLAAWPEAEQQPIHPADARFFVGEVCARPGKPVPFVPVIDADVRRWYKADSLWQSHDDRFDAQGVLVIPGPAATAGIERVDEPVAELLGRFDGALRASLVAKGDEVAPLARRQGRWWPRPIAGLAAHAHGQELHIEAAAGVSDTAWFARVAEQVDGPLAGLFGAARVIVGKQHVANPIWRICRAQAGARLRLQLDANAQATALHYCERPGGHEAVHLTVQQDPTHGSVLLLRLEVPNLPGSACAADFCLRFVPVGDDGLRFSWLTDTADRLRQTWQRLLFDAALPPTELFEMATAEVHIDSEQAQALAAISAAPPGALAPTLPFTLLWKPLFQALSAGELASGLLDLVHLDNRIERTSAFTPAVGDVLAGQARVVAIEDAAAGRTVTIIGRLLRGDAVWIEMRSRFFIRGSFACSAFALRRQEPWQWDITLSDAAAVHFFVGHPWFEPTPGVELRAGDRLTLDVQLLERRPRRGKAEFSAQGIARRDGEVVGTLALAAEQVLAEVTRHPLEALVELLAAPGVPNVDTPRRTLGRATVEAPADMATFAEVGGDLNPLHRCTAMARLAGLDGVIVHGMWTAARVGAFLVETAAGGVADRLADFETAFLAPVLPGETLQLVAARVAMAAGEPLVEATATVLRDGEDQLVLRARARLKAPRTAFVFPGQGIQQAGMGMDGYARSRAARAIWDQADRFTRAALGFSILAIVRDNPTELIVDGAAQVHPKGVLNLTQFTQVAMAVLARAQVAELRAAGVLSEHAIACGHSVGEYNAISAITEVLPLEAVVDIVYQRGLVMHHLVPRDAEGVSGFGMGVVRPHYAGLDHAGAEALVAEVADQTGKSIQIVNFNVRDRQYSVTGEEPALAAFAAALRSREAPGGKPAWLRVPGIDVPFHSRILIGGVDSFRQTLRDRLPLHIDPARLVGRYVPNLIARPFSLERAFVQAIVDCTDDAHLGTILNDWAAWQARPSELARVVLIELLAWQFASPVRWIETQELLFRPMAEGGLGVQRLVEVGVGYQPTLRNMAAQTLAGLSLEEPPEVLHCDADVALVWQRDEDEKPAPASAEAPADAASDVASAVRAVASPAAAQAAVAAPVAAPAAASPVTGSPVTDRPWSVATALNFILALQARVRPDQIEHDETIDGLFEGVSSRRNQVLLDIGAEFGLGTIDGAHERPLTDLATEIGRRCPSWRAPGAYVGAAWDAAISRVFGRTGLAARELNDLLEAEFGLPEGLRHAAFAAIALDTREGNSGRGGALGRLADTAPADRGAALATLEKLASLLAADTGLAIGRRSATAAAGGAAVDAAVVSELQERILGPDGILAQQGRDMAARLGHGTARPGIVGEPGPEAQAATAALELWRAEHGDGVEAAIAGTFDARQHVAFASIWASARRDLARLHFDARNGRVDAEGFDSEVLRLSGMASDQRLVDMARLAASQCRDAGQQAWARGFARIAAGGATAAVPVVPSRPKLIVNPDGSLQIFDAPDLAPGAHERFVASLWAHPAQADVRVGADGRWDDKLGEVLRAAGEQAMDFRGRTALITGASPGSIALQIAAHLLRGGARVVLTTSRPGRARMQAYRRFYQEHAGAGAELHVVPFNQASTSDIDGLLDWLFAPITEQAGATVRVIKRPFAPDLLIPFAAIGDVATMNTMGGRAEVAIRAMLLGVERLVAGVASRYLSTGVPRRPCHVLLPMSPNHGGFGGDGAYAETKAALEVLPARWRSEHDAWGRATTLCSARIGWVRGTGLMDANDAVAARLEEQTGVRTFASAEMGLLLAALCTETMAALATDAPLEADLTGRFASITDIRERVGAIRDQMTAQSSRARRMTELQAAEGAALGLAPPPSPPVAPLPAWHAGPAAAAPTIPAPADSAPADSARGAQPGGAELKRMVVVVSTGEIGPWGSARTRFELEVADTLSPAAVLELAWLTGLVRYDAGSWVDGDSGDAVAESDIATRYLDAVRARSGVRLVDAESAGFDPEAMPVYAVAWLERDLTFPVASEEEARCFVAAAPETTIAALDPQTDRWQVTRLAGTEIRVPKAVKLSRRVAGLVPQGFDPARLGLPRDMVENVDRVTLFNLVATADAFLSAGLEPEELLRWLHPARVANTQGGGIGGMRSLGRLYVDHVLGRERQSDVLQETLINVMAAYVVQSYVGSYGAMAHPVGACATAAVSYEEAVDKILLDKADFVVAGGFDDIGPDGVIGFADMNATAATDDMLAMGLEPDQMSRANDVRRRGFVEGQGGATVLLARGDVAARLGLPVEGVLAYAASFGDGIHKSIPAPGMGVLACAAGGTDSPLGQALSRHGLSADDIALVYKHDTSTGANDPNENALHQRIQQALGRTPGNPLFVVSQKSLTGHAKGGAAAWQLVGLCQSLNSGQVPGNRNLDSVDPAMAAFDHLVFSDTTLQPGPAVALKAGLLTSLGFGHVGAIALVLHPDAFVAALPAADRARWVERMQRRRDAARRTHAEVLMGERRLFEKRGHRRFVSPDGSAAQTDEEAAMLLDPGARLDPKTGLFVGAGGES